MLKTVEGFYRNGKIELPEVPTDLGPETRVLVTFLDGAVDLVARGIDERQAMELRNRLATFAEEWDSPEMSTYDNYETNHPDVPSR